MCGFVGIIGEEDPDLIRGMTDSIRHRGPDGEGYYTDPGISLGHRRLAIIDLVTGDQPIISDDKRYVIVHNGEVYNHLDLRAELEQAGRKFHTHADTEVVLQGFIHYGPEVVEKLRGMFAFAIWDAKEKSCFIARDHMGIKPLYYGQFDGRFYVASEMKAILADPRVPRRCDLRALDAFLTFLKYPVDLTAFEGIRQLEAGHYMIVHDGQHRITPYYDIAWPESFPKKWDEEEIIERTLAAAGETVKLRLMSDVPLGMFLSGGVDSSLVTALMAKESSAPVRTFSLVHKGDASWLDESQYIHRIVSHLGTEHTEIESDWNWYQMIPRMLSAFDQPCTTSLNSYMISELASRHVKVALTGTGGDEAFAGYGRYLLGLGLGSRPVPWPKALARLLLGRRKKQPDNLGDAFYERKVYFNTQQKQEAYSEKFLERTDETMCRAIMDRFFNRPGLPDGLSRCLYTDQKLYLVSNLHNNLDKVSMAHGLEARVPLCDHKFMEFANTVPSALKTKDGELKYVLKKAASRLVPPEVIYRQKRGFGIPIRTWVRGAFAEVVKRVLNRESIERRGLLRWPYVDKLMARTFSGKGDYSIRLWMFMLVELWHRMYIDSKVFLAPMSFEDLTR